MANQTSGEELVIRSGGNVTNGGNGGQTESAVETAAGQRIAVARGTQKPSAELVERYESILDAYTQKVEEAIDVNIQKASSTPQPQAGLDVELGEPITGFGYKWWDIYLLGPIQSIGRPPFRPNKIIAGGEYAFFLAFVVKNPLPTPGGGPSALTLLNCRKFCLNAELMNLTKVTDGPDIQIFGEFDDRVVQSYLLIFYPPVAEDCKPDLYEINLTADVTDCPQPFAAFATRMFDIDYDPNGLPFPLDARKGPHIHDEQPLRFLVYKR